MSGPRGSAALADRQFGETADGDVLRVAEWERDVPGVVAGITTRASGNFAFSSASTDEWLARYQGLARRLGFRGVALARQVHGTQVRRVGEIHLGSPWNALASDETSPGPAILVTGQADGLVTDRADILLTVTAADCVPVYLLDPGGRLALLHAGWRGAAGGVLRRGIEALAVLGSEAAALRLHLGAAICGDCYEVDRPVLAAFGIAADRALLDLRGLLVEQAIEAGLLPGRITVSAVCTRCESPRLESHRAAGEAAGRMAAFIGFRSDPHV